MSTLASRRVMNFAIIRVAHYGDVLTDFSLKYHSTLFIPQLDLIDGYSYIALQIMPSKKEVVARFLDFSRSYKDVKSAETLKIPGVPQTILLIKRNYGVLKAIRKVGGMKLGPVAVEMGFKHFPVFIPRGSELKLLKYVREFSPCDADVKVSRASPDTENLLTTPTLTEYEFRVLRLAYEEGFFEWPRGVGLEELASVLGISKATTAEHLRKAVKKLAEAYLRAHSYMRWQM
ncbi:MAG: helix-turn-helix domain-containing protein [Desulfurococcaceae archaeon]